jgi:hypothetical protein
MARFRLNRPITSGEPTIVVDGGLPAGRHRFRLEVIDSTGQRSSPSDVVVTVTDTGPSRPPFRPGTTPIRPPTDAPVRPR